MLRVFLSPAVLLFSGLVLYSMITAISIGQGHIMFSLIMVMTLSILTIEKIDAIFESELFKSTGSLFNFIAVVVMLIFFGEIMFFEEHHITKYLMVHYHLTGDASIRNPF